MAKRRNVCRQAIRKDGSLEFSVENSRNWWILDGFKWTTIPLAPTCTDIHIIHIRWLILIDDAKNLLVESNWGGMVYLWFIDSLIDWLIDWLIDSFIHSFIHSYIWFLFLTEAQRATQSSHCSLSGAGGESWYLMQLTPLSITMTRCFLNCRLKTGHDMSWRDSLFVDVRKSVHLDLHCKRFWHRRKKNGSEVLRK